MFICQWRIREAIMFKVIVCGSELDHSSDELVASAMAHCYREIGWKDVKVTEEEENDTVTQDTTGLLC